jgi:hypothetical protein
MTISTPMSDDVMRAADGTPLKKKLQQTMRREQVKALVLIAPLLIFIILTFIMPIGIPCPQVCKRWPAGMEKNCQGKKPLPLLRWT